VVIQGQVRLASSSCEQRPWVITDTSADEASADMFSS